MSLNPELKRFLINPPSESGLIYDLSTMAANAKETKAKLGSHNLLIAVKSFPDSKGLGKLLPQIDGADISNYNEYKLVREHAEKSTSTLWLTRCPLGDFRKILAENANCFLWFNVENITDIPELISLQQNFKFHIALRINTSGILHFTHSHFINSRFGLGQAELENTLTQYGDKIEGIHLHHGSERNNAELMLLFLKQMKQLQVKHSFLKMFNLGGGWNLQDPELINQIKRSDLNLTLEPGRYFGEGCGYAFSTITAIRKFESWIYLEGSLSPNANLKWSADIKNTILPLGNEREELSGALYYGSRSCDESDRVQISTHGTRKIAVGDVIIFTGISTYSLAWNHSFNGIEIPVYMLE